MSKSHFYILSLLSGFFEIAPFVLVMQRFGVLSAFAVVLCYQLGNLSPCPIRLSRGAAKVSAVLGVALLAAFAFWGYLFFLCAATALLSAAIQTVRSTAKTSTNKAAKRIVRVTGFCLGFFGSPAALLAAGVAAVVSVSHAQDGFARSKCIFPRLNGINGVMILHQMHYFPYCYAVIALSVIHGGNFVALALFLAGWVTYIGGARLYQKHSLLASFFTGHVILLALLLGMYFVPSMPVKALLWILTGLVGTTEFSIVKLARERGGNPEGETFAENVGHVLGVAAGLAAYAVTGNLLATLLVGATGALGAMALMVVNTKKNILRGGEHARTSSQG